MQTTGFPLEGDHSKIQWRFIIRGLSRKHPSHCQYAIVTLSGWILSRQCWYTNEKESGNLISMKSVLPPILLIYVFKWEEANVYFSTHRYKNWFNNEFFLRRQWNVVMNRKEFPQWVLFFFSTFHRNMLGSSVYTYFLYLLIFFTDFVCVNIITILNKI